MGEPTAIVSLIVLAVIAVVAGGVLAVSRR
jgi:hypothetical protein